MASEIRVDKINSLSGVGTVTLSPTGIDIAGITTAATLRATTGIVTSLTSGSLTSLGAVSGTTGTFSAAVSGTTGTFSSDVKSTAGILDIRSGSSINTNVTGSSASGTLHKNTTSGEFAVVSGGTGGNNFLSFYTSASAAPTEKARITSGGSLLVGQTSDDGKLCVQGAAGGVALQTTDATNSTFRISHPSSSVTLLSGGSSQHLALGTGFAEKLRINSSGYLGVNETSPLATLHVQGHNITNGTVFLEPHSDKGNNISHIHHGSNGDWYIRPADAAGYIYFDIGKARFTNGILFGSDTAAANTLDDYEEGTYTPTLSCTTSGSITLNTSYNKMAYEKIGNWINVHGRVRVSSTSSPSGGQLRFSLPYQSKTFTGEGDAGRLFGVATIQNADENENHYGIGPTINGETYVQIHNINTDNTSAIDVCSQVNSNSLIAINVTNRPV